MKKNHLGHGGIFARRSAFFEEEETCNHCYSVLETWILIRNQIVTCFLFIELDFFENLRKLDLFIT